MKGLAVVGLLLLAVLAADAVQLKRLRVLSRRGKHASPMPVLAEIDSRSLDVSVSTFAGGEPGYADGSAREAQFQSPAAVSIALADGSVVVADSTGQRVRRVTPHGDVVTVAGSGITGNTDGTHSDASFNFPAGVAVAEDFTIYVADMLNNKIRRISPDGTVDTLAGGEKGFADGTGAAAQFSSPYSVALAADGSLYVSDYGNNRIRRVTAAGVVTTLAGKAEGFSDGQGEDAAFDGPWGLAFGPDGSLFVADSNNHRVRRVSMNGDVKTVAGTGEEGSANGDAMKATFGRLSGLAVGQDGTIFVADQGSNKIRVISDDGEVSDFAGSGAVGSQNGAGDKAEFSDVRSIALASGDLEHGAALFVADADNARVRKISFPYIPTPQEKARLKAVERVAAAAGAKAGEDAGEKAAHDLLVKSRDDGAEAGAEAGRKAGIEAAHAEAKLAAEAIATDVAGTIAKKVATDIAGEAAWKTIEAAIKDAKDAGKSAGQEAGAAAGGELGARKAEEVATKVAKEVGASTAADVASDVARKAALEVGERAGKDAGYLSGSEAGKAMGDASGKKAAIDYLQEQAPQLRDEILRAAEAEAEKVAADAGDKAARIVARTVASKIADDADASAEKIAESIAQQVAEDIAERAGRAAGRDAAVETARHVAEQEARRQGEAMLEEAHKVAEAAAEYGGHVAGREEVVDYMAAVEPELQAAAREAGSAAGASAGARAAQDEAHRVAEDEAAKIEAEVEAEAQRIARQTAEQVAGEVALRAGELAGHNAGVAAGAHAGLEEATKIARESEDRARSTAEVVAKQATNAEARRAVQAAVTAQLPRVTQLAKGAGAEAGKVEGYHQAIVVVSRAADKIKAELLDVAAKKAAESGAQAGELSGGAIARDVAQELLKSAQADVEALARRVSQQESTDQATKIAHVAGHEAGAAAGREAGAREGEKAAKLMAHDIATSTIEQLQPVVESKALAAVQQAIDAAAKQATETAVAEAQKAAIKIAAEEGAKAADVVAKLEAQKAEQAAYQAALLADAQEQHTLEAKMHEVAQQEDAQALKDVKAQFEQFKAQLQERFQIVEEATRQIEDYLIPVEDKGAEALAKAEADDAKEAAAADADSPAFRAKRAARAARAAMASTRRLMDSLPRFPEMPSSAAGTAAGTKRLRASSMAETAEQQQHRQQQQQQSDLPEWLRKGQFRAPKYTDE